mgnify:CR=1 FL=1
MNTFVHEAVAKYAAYVMSNDVTWAALGSLHAGSSSRTLAPALPTLTESHGHEGRVWQKDAHKLAREVAGHVALPHR